MAGDWIKVEDCLPDKPEVVGIASSLGLDQDAVVGKLIRLWAWADQQTVDGCAVSVTKAFIDRLAFAPGFADAMREVGWLVASDGKMAFPNFERHNGETAKQRALAAKRMARGRAKNVAQPAQQKRNQRREEKSKGGVPPLTPLAGENAKHSEPLGTPSDGKNSDQASDKTDTPPLPAKVRKRDELFDAVAEVTASDLIVSRSHVGRICKLLREASPPYSPDEVRRWAQRTREQWQIQPTLGMIEKYIGKIRSNDLGVFDGKQRGPAGPDLFSGIDKFKARHAE